MTEVITAGIPSAIKNHFFTYNGGFIFAFGGKIRENPQTVIRKISLESFI